MRPLAVPQRSPTCVDKVVEGGVKEGLGNIEASEKVRWEIKQA